MLTGPLDPNVHVADRLQFNLNAEEKKPFKGMTPSQSLNMAYELIAQASVCLNYTVGTTKPLLVTELENAQKELAALKEKNDTLSHRLEELTKSAEDEKTKATTALQESKNQVAALKRSNDTLTLDLQKANTNNTQLVKEKETMTAERDKLLLENASLEDQVCEEQKLGFEQGIAQCHCIFNTPLQHPEFDIMKVFVDSRLVKLSVDPAAEEESSVIPPVLDNTNTEPPHDLTVNIPAP